MLSIIEQKTLDTNKKISMLIKFTWRRQRLDDWKEARRKKNRQGDQAAPHPLGRHRRSVVLAVAQRSAKQLIAHPAVKFDPLLIQDLVQLCRIDAIIAQQQRP